jgi:L-rhamnose mutarotase
MYATAVTFQLLPGCLEAYKKAHDQLWPELVEAFHQNEVSMLIYHFEGRLFLYATAPSEEHMKRSHPLGVAEKWSAYMATMMVCDEGGQAIVETLEPAFLFGRFAQQA